MPAPMRNGVADPPPSLLGWSGRAVVTCGPSAWAVRVSVEVSVADGGLVLA